MQIAPTGFPGRLGGYRLFVTVPVFRSVEDEVTDPCIAEALDPRPSFR